MKPNLKDLEKRVGAKPKIRMAPMRTHKGIRIAYLPDLQDKPFATKEHLRWIGAWLKDRTPDVIVQAGDFFDMGSCSTHDEAGSISAEGRSITADLASGREALGILNETMGGPCRRTRRIITLGNHEKRLYRYVDEHPEHRDTYADDPFGFERHGWEVVPFLQPIEVAGVWFSHYFVRAGSGRVTQTRNGAPNALTMIKREMRSCVAGHMQGLDVACLPVGGRVLRGVIAGSAYPWHEDYLSPQGQGHFRGVLEFNEVHDGYFDLVEASLDFLCRRYGKGRWPK